ncbi:hypothetical protein [Amphiplicatus metriothermophilus]|uniref:hypothetical protein n=1 Tax=Amphiplicatus metriothermophilus TaxID=1519374 RepID=UPI0013595DE2|nr:hypothetical protein [Amphiplicatus metriothermophilus]MBB5517924.1 hypothetical protein [Amphiplicatus metriothermophilus]
MREAVTLHAQEIPCHPDNTSPLTRLAAQAYRASAELARARPAPRRLDVLR